MRSLADYLQNLLARVAMLLPAVLIRDRARRIRPWRVNQSSREISHSPSVAAASDIHPGSGPVRVCVKDVGASGFRW